MRGEKIRAIRKTGRGRLPRRPLAEILESRLLLTTYVVNTPAEFAYPQPYPTTPDPAQAMGLGDAINFANAHPGNDRIEFKIDTGPQTIFLTSPLPTIRDAVTIDGTTQPGFTSPPIIGITPLNTSTKNADGLYILASNTTIQSLAIYGFSGAGAAGIHIGNRAVTVQGCNIGVDQSNRTAYPNYVGIEIETGTNVRIGGSSDLTKFQSNLISGNTTDGILIDSTASNNFILGNYIGTDNTGLIAIPNGGNGINVQGTGNNIGSDQSGEGNVISGNTGDGILISSRNNVVRGNKIGVSFDASQKIGNYIGIYVLADNNTIGGLPPSTGTTPDDANPNSNYIGGNRADGIRLFLGTNTLIQGNYIGTDSTKTVNLGNQFNGIFDNYGSTGTRIGGSQAGAGNVIAFNGGGASADPLLGNGITLESDVTNIPILGNSIFSNALLGINLYATGDLPNGVTPNDGPGDPDTGPNGLQNFPVLTYAATAAGKTQVMGTLDSTANTRFRIEFFASPQGSPSGYGEGKTLIGAYTATTDNLGHVAFNAILPSPTTRPAFLTATATPIISSTLFGGTSEFSQFTSVDVGQVSDLNVKLTASPNPATVGTNLSAFNLQLVNWGDGSSIPTSGNSQVFVGIDNANLLHIRVFDASGLKVTDTDETKLPPSQAAAIASLKQSIPGLLPPHTLTPQETAQVLSQVSLLVEPYVTFTATVTNSGSAVATNVIFTESLPGGLFPDTINDPTSLTSSQGTVAIVNGQIQGNLGTIAVGQSVTITVKVLPTTKGDITSTASVQGDQIDNYDPNNSSSATVSVKEAADLSLVIKPPTTPPIVGQKTAFVAIISNPGPGQATGITFDFTLPPNVTFVSATSDIGKVEPISGSTVRVNVGNMPSGPNSQVAVRIVVIPTSVGPVTISGQLGLEQIDPDYSNNSAAASTIVLTSSDLSVNLTPDQPAALRNQNLSFTALVVNNGPDTANNASIRFRFPQNGTYLGLTTTPSVSGTPTLNPDGSVSLALGNLAPGAQIQVNLLTLAQSGGTFSVSASVNSGSGDIVPDNNQSSASVLIDPIDLSVTQSASPSPAEIGRNLTYSLSVQNTGLAGATGVTVYDQLPASVDFVSGTVAIDGGTVTYNSATHTATITIGSIPAGGSVPVSLVVVPRSSTSLTNLVGVSGVETDVNSSNNTSTLSTVVSPADLSISVSAPSDVVAAGSPLTFTSTVTNNGPSTAPGVQYFQSLPDRTQFVSIHSSQGNLSYSNGQIIGSLGDLGSNGTATVTLVLIPLSGGSSTSTASVSSPSVIDSDTSNNQASAAATVINQPGSVQFASNLYQAFENSGYASLTLTRQGGTQGEISVRYTTVADGSARPGVNFTPVSQVVTFADGETSKTVFVPVSADGTFESYTFLHVALTDPTGGASIGAQSSTILAILNTDIDTVPLQVTTTTLIASGATISGVQLGFTKPLDPVSASSPTNFFLIGPDGQFVLTYPPIYNPLNNSVTLVPAVPLTVPSFYTVVVNGAADGLHDYHGTVLDGNNDTFAGGNFIESFARGSSLAYVDATGNLVNLQLSRGGLLEMFRDASGNAKILNVLPPVSGRSLLTGSVQRFGTTATGVTSLGQVSGLGFGGPVRSGLTTPPFYVTSMINTAASIINPRRPHRGQARVSGVPLPRWFHRTV